MPHALRLTEPFHTELFVASSWIVHRGEVLGKWKDVHAHAHSALIIVVTE